MKGSTMTTFDINDDLIRRLASLLTETGLTEIEFAEGEKRIRVTRTVNMVAPVSAAPAAPAPATAAPAPAPVALPPAQHPGTLKSPMVGTVYLSSDPSTPPFVKVGDAVQVGQTLLIIEAMKVMNPIKATKAGTVVQVVVKDSNPVEFGEPLLIIE